MCLAEDLAQSKPLVKDGGDDMYWSLFGANSWERTGPPGGAIHNHTVSVTVNWDLCRQIGLCLHPITENLPQELIENQPRVRSQRNPMSTQRLIAVDHKELLEEDSEDERGGPDQGEILSLLVTSRGQVTIALLRDLHECFLADAPVPAPVPSTSFSMCCQDNVSEMLI
ncbi:hypothetical protein MG293_020590 [Ovis ammon polii]|uniref:Uncharacterized protein n=1 Tax=Ovis ammon polii TaxID=230172 RepID=A0AAD4TMT2_OVIAM|nr:hypothetical protein MG293_020590 [Ovis ammon polii]